LRENPDLEAGFSMEPEPKGSMLCVAYGLCGAGFETSLSMLAGFEVLGATMYLVAVLLWNALDSRKLCTLLIQIQGMTPGELKKNSLEIFG
jgi:hypothetical protein